MSTAIERFFQGYVDAFNRSLGDTVAVEGIRTTPIDAAHQMATVDYRATYERPTGRMIEIDFAVTYLLATRDDTFEIFALEAGDEMALYREHGLIPDSAP